MQEERQESQAVDSVINTAHTIQAVHAVFNAVKGGTAAAGTAVGTALGGPQWAVVGALLMSKRFAGFWRQLLQRCFCGLLLL